MWDIHSTTRLLMEMSQSTEPAELVRLFFEHVRRGADLQRALVMNNAGLSFPSYRLVHHVISSQETGCSVLSCDEIRVGGLLAELLYNGKFDSLVDFAVDPSDPAFDLLAGSRSLTAFPLFERGSPAGLVVMLSASARLQNAAERCALAMVSSLLGRAIETQKLANQLATTCRLLDSELEAAASVQRWLLPSLPAIDNLQIAASYRTARHSGGDYYDLGLLPDGRLGILIADVSGKGAPAAVIMAMLRSIVHDEMDRARLTGPAALLDYVDNRLRALSLPQRGAFVSAFCCTLNMATGALVYSNAGHPPPRLLRERDRIVVSLDGAKTIPLGLLDEPSTHLEETILFLPGDLALFYTDGITEARSLASEFFNVERLDRVLCDLSAPIAADAAVERITKAVASFEAKETPADDQTLVGLARCPHVENCHNATSPCIVPR